MTGGIGLTLNPHGILNPNRDQAYRRPRDQFITHLDRTAQAGQRHQLILNQLNINAGPSAFTHKEAKGILRVVFDDNGLRRGCLIKIHPQKERGLAGNLHLNPVGTRSHIHAVLTRGIGGNINRLRTLLLQREQTHRRTRKGNAIQRHRTAQTNQSNQLILGQHHIHCFPSTLTHKESKSILGVVLHHKGFRLCRLIKVYAQKERGLTRQPHLNFIQTGGHAQVKQTRRIGHTLNPHLLCKPGRDQAHFGTRHRHIPHLHGATQSHQCNPLIFLQSHVDLLPGIVAFAHKKSKRLVRVVFRNHNLPCLVRLIRGQPQEQRRTARHLYFNFIQTGWHVDAIRTRRIGNAHTDRRTLLPRTECTHLHTRQGYIPHHDRTMQRNKRNRLTRRQLDVDLRPGRLGDKKVKGFFRATLHRHRICLADAQEQRCHARQLNLNPIRTGGQSHFIQTFSIRDGFDSRGLPRTQREQTHRSPRDHACVILHLAVQRYQRHQLGRGQRYLQLFAFPTHKKVKRLLRSIFYNHRTVRTLSQEERSLARQLDLNPIGARGHIHAVQTRHIGDTLDFLGIHHTRRQQAHFGPRHNRIILFDRTTHFHQGNRLRRIQGDIQEYPAIPVHKEIMGIVPIALRNHPLVRGQPQKQRRLARHTNLNTVQPRRHLQTIGTTLIGHHLKTRRIHRTRRQ